MILRKSYRLAKILLLVSWVALGYAMDGIAQRFVRPIPTIADLIISNPNDPHTNVFIPQGPTGPGLFYQWRKNDTGATNIDQSVLDSTWPGASGKWYNIPLKDTFGIGGGGISNSGTNGVVVVNTIADLRNVPGNLGIGLVYVRGHSQPDDWGRGFFSRMDTCTQTDDDAYYIVGNTSTVCWAREADFPWAGIPVQYFGGTISIASINRATAYMATLGGGLVWITDGEWPVDTLNEGPILGHSNVSIGGSSAALLVGNGGDMLNWTNVSNAGILQLVLSNAANGIVLRGCTNVLIAGNTIATMTDDGIRQYGGSSVRIEANIFSSMSNAVHYSLDGSTKAIAPVLMNNTFGTIVGANVLVDSGALDGRQQFDSGDGFHLTQTNSTIWFGVDRMIHRPGTENTFVGQNAGGAWVSGNFNTALGKDALLNNTAPSGTAIGSLALKNNTTGFENVAVGRAALTGNTTGNDNVAVGTAALGAVTMTGSDNVAVGHFSGGGGSGSTNVAIGKVALAQNTTGNRNVAVGWFAGNSATGAVDSIFIGSGSGPRLNNRDVVNTIVLGNGMTNEIDNAVWIGNYLNDVLLFGEKSGWHRGTGSPEGVVTAPVGHFYTREDGGAGTCLYIKESGTGNTGWVTAGTGGASSVAGSDTQVQFNDGGVFGADSDFTWNKTSNVLTMPGGRLKLGDGDATSTAIGRSTDLGTGINFGNQQVSFFLNTFEYVRSSPSGFRISSSAGLGFDIASGSPRLIYDGAGQLAIQNGNEDSKFRWYSQYAIGGHYERGALNTVDGSHIEIAAETAGTGADNLDVRVTPAGTGTVYLNGTVRTVGNVGIGAASDPSALLNLNGAKLNREADDVLAIQDGTDNQTVRIYGSTNSGTGEWSRLKLLAGNDTYIVTEQSASGTTSPLHIGTDLNANIFFRVNSTDEWQVSGTTGTFGTVTDNDEDIGGANASRPANIWAGTAIMTPRVYWNQPTNTVFDTAGSGSPEGVITADSGSTYRRYDGGAGTSFYVKETGDGSNTGWVAK